MADRFNDEELLFIQETLDMHGEDVADLLMEAIEAKQLIKEGNLLGSIEYRVTYEGRSPKLSIKFPDYGRFIEINFHKKSTNSTMWNDLRAERNSAVIGGRSRPKLRRKKKDTRFYSKTAYGTLNELIGKIMYGYSDIELQRVKELIKNGSRPAYMN